MAWIAEIVENAGELVAADEAKSAAGTAAQRASDAADLAYERSKFKGFDVQGAFGEATIDEETGQAGFNLTPEMQAIQDQFQAQAQGFAGQGQT